MFGMTYTNSSAPASLSPLQLEGLPGSATLSRLAPTGDGNVAASAWG